MLIFGVSLNAPDSIGVPLNMDYVIALEQLKTLPYTALKGFDNMSPEVELGDPSYSVS